ncbi:hypothetical protein GBAR_LOCUS17282, partial [Geodia barretti]
MDYVHLVRILLLCYISINHRVAMVRYQTRVPKVLILLTP